MYGSIILIQDWILNSSINRTLTFGIIPLFAGILLCYLFILNDIMSPFSSNLRASMFTNSITALPILLATITFLYGRLESNVFRPLDLAYTEWEKLKTSNDSELKKIADKKLAIFKTKVKSFKPMTGDLIRSLIILLISVIIFTFNYFSNT
jgi:hypothetical protein